MAQEAERLLRDAGWLPEPLQLLAATDVEEVAADGGATAIGETDAMHDTDADEVPPIAAE